MQATSAQGSPGVAAKAPARHPHTASLRRRSIERAPTLGEHNAEIPAGGELGRHRALSGVGLPRATLDLRSTRALAQRLTERVEDGVVGRVVAGERAAVRPCDIATRTHDEYATELSLVTTLAC